MKNKHAQQLGKLGGQVKSETKAKAVRENGKLGGRPRKDKEKTDDLPRCEDCKTFLGDSTMATCKCGRYSW